MEHWAQKCDGAGVDPAEHAAVCKERDRLQVELQKVIGELHEVKSELDAAIGAIGRSIVACYSCRHDGMGLPCDEMVPAPDCDECTLEKTICCKCYDGSNFEFAGMKEETK